MEVEGIILLVLNPLIYFARQWNPGADRWAVRPVLAIFRDKPDE
jgi:hypothetical protein